MRDLMMFASMLFLVPMALSNAFVAYLFWIWTAEFSPNFYLYGFMGSVRYNLLFSVIAIGLFLLGKLEGRGEFKYNRTAILFVMFLVHASFSYLFSYEPNPLNETYYIFFVKSLICALVMPLFLTSRLRIHATLIVFALGLGFHGVIEGLKVVVTGGAHHVNGLSTTMLSDNNHFAIGMVIVMPIMYYLWMYSVNKFARFGFLVSLLLIMVSVLGTNSRGGFVGLLVIAIWLIFTSRHKLLAISVVVISTIAVYIVAPDSWFSRIETIQSASNDSSFMGRVIAWKVSSAIALDSPIFGGGFHALQNQWIWDRFFGNDGLLFFVNTDPFPILAKAAHSIYFEVLGDLGFGGLFFFILIIINALYTRIEIKKLTRNFGSRCLWASDLADLLAVSVIAYAVGGAAVSLAYLEAIYLVFMLMEVVKQVVRMQVSGIYGEEVGDTGLGKRANAFAS